MAIFYVPKLAFSLAQKGCAGPEADDKSSVLICVVYPHQMIIGLLA